MSSPFIHTTPQRVVEASRAYLRRPDIVRGRMTVALSPDEKSVIIDTSNPSAFLRLIASPLRDDEWRCLTWYTERASRTDYEFTELAHFAHVASDPHDSASDINPETLGERTIRSRWDISPLSDPIHRKLLGFQSHLEEVCLGLRTMQKIERRNAAALARLNQPILSA